MFYKIAFCCALSLPVLSHADTTGDVDYVTTDRYTSVNIKPRADQYDALDSLVTFVFSEDVKTVGDAIRNALEGSSYSWQAPAKIDNSGLDTLSLPVVNRDMGPTRLRDALSALAGSAWDLQVDVQSRTLWFTPKKQKGLFRPRSKQ
jgi:conjugative transfer region protein (TIGR03748 family)